MLNQLIEKNKVKLSDEGTGKSKKSDKITKSKKSVIDCTRLNNSSDKSISPINDDKIPKKKNELVAYDTFTLVTFNEKIKFKKQPNKINKEIALDYINDFNKDKSYDD